MDNYKIQADQARALFLTYDREALIRKLRLRTHGEWMYTTLFSQPYRISRETARIEKWEGEWVPGDSFGETMTLLDLVCDSREDRSVSGKFKNMADFGLLFHKNLLETDPWALYFQNNIDRFRRACEALGGKPFPRGDGAYVFRIFEDLPVAVQLWLGDEEYPPNLRLLWDENALQYLKYETMHFAKGFLLQKIRKAMEQSACMQDGGGPLSYIEMFEIPGNSI